MAPGATGTATITVTSTGFGGNNFVPAQQAGGMSAASVSATVVVVLVHMKLEQVGPTVISADGSYSEDTTIRITAVRADTGATLTNFTGTINIAEDNTQIYSQNGGSIPTSVNILPGDGGTATFVAKSLAGPSAEGAQGTKPIDAKIKTTNWPVYGGTSLAIPQWVISGQQIDPRASGPTFDWLQTRTRDLFAAATSDVASVFATMSSYASGIGNWAGQTPSSRTPQTPVTINPYFQTMRLNSATTSLCGNSRIRALSHVLLHEARHAYQNSRAAAANNDQDQDFLVNSIPVFPNDIFLDSATSRTVCDQSSGLTESRSYKGDNVFDSPGPPDYAFRAHEQDSNVFATNHQ